MASDRTRGRNKISTREEDLYSYTPKGSAEISSASSEDDSLIHPRHSKRRNNLSEDSKTNPSKQWKLPAKPKGSRKDSSDKEEYNIESVGNFTPVSSRKPPTSRTNWVRKKKRNEEILLEKASQRVRDLRTEKAGMQRRLTKMNEEIANKKRYLEKLNDDIKEKEAGLDQLLGATIKKFQALQDKVESLTEKCGKLSKELEEERVKPV